MTRNQAIASSGGTGGGPPRRHRSRSGAESALMAPSVAIAATTLAHVEPRSLSRAMASPHRSTPMGSQWLRFISEVLRGGWNLSSGAEPTPLGPARAANPTSQPEDALQAWRGLTDAPLPMGDRAGGPWRVSQRSIRRRRSLGSGSFNTSA